MDRGVTAYCSWCFKKTIHQLNGAGWKDSTYSCSNCNNPTKSCLAPTCSDFARNLEFLPKKLSVEEFGKPLDYYRNVYCAQHSGILPSFESLYQKIDDLGDYETFKTNKKHNLRKYTDRALFYTVMLAIGIDLMPDELFSDYEPTETNQKSGVTSDEEALQIDKSHIDQETINSIQSDKVLRGALLTSATIGVAFTNPNFKIIEQNKKEQKGSSSIIFINGFLTKGELDYLKWNNGFNKFFDDAKKYSIDWDSKTLSPRNPFYLFKKKVSKNAYLAEIISKWFGAKDNCVMTARGFAAIMSRTKHANYTDFAGHSLGCLFIQSVLDQYLSLGPSPIRNIYLFGGAVDNDQKLWEKQIKKIHGKVYNFYSDNDDVLKYAYKSTTLFSSTPIGLSGINVYSKKIINIDVSHIINGHNEYKTKLQECLDYASKIHPIKGRWYERIKRYLTMKFVLKRSFRKRIL